VPTLNPPSTPAVALLLFNRPELTQRVVDEVVAANPKDVYLIADGPRPDHPDDERLCEEVRHIATQAPWTGTVHTDFSAQNLGLKRRVSTGLDWVFDHEEQAIILEDDCLPDPSFFRFAEELLDRYKTDERVGMISGNNFLWGAAISPDSYFFSPDVRIWGWATWRRVWRGFSETGLDKSRSRSEVANLLTAITSPTRNRSLARIQRNASKNSWAQPFLLHCLERGYVNPTPRANLVTNIGFGGDSTHTAFESFTAQVPRGSLSLPLTHPGQVAPADGLGPLESRAHWRRWVTFPLRHPLDFAGRVTRFLLGRLR